MRRHGRMSRVATQARAARRLTVAGRRVQPQLTLLLSLLADLNGR
jgi:hypothetical protein